MKRLIGILLAVLMLCGCAVQPPETEPPTVPTTEYVPPTEPSGSYLPDSEAELQSGGAVRAYPMTEENCYAIAMAGEDVLLFSGLDQTVLTRLAGENLYTVAQTQLDLCLSPDDPGFRITENGITYYDSGDRSLVYLDEKLQEVSRVTLPADMTGSPILSEDRLKLYYCTQEAIRVLDLETGLDRLLKQMAYPEQQLEDILMDDSILLCSIQEAKGETALFVSTETGELLCQRDHDLVVSSWENKFYVRLPEGILQTYLFGTPGEQLRMLNLPEQDATVFYLESRDAAVTSAVVLGNVTLDYFRLDNGLRSGSVTLTGIPAPCCMETGAESGLIYFLCDDTSNGERMLYRWDPKFSPTGDEANYTSVRYTLMEPDTVGLEMCALRAQQLNERYGVQILVGMDAVAVEPWDYELYPEYQVPAIQMMLDEMERILAVYPDGFFQTLSQQSNQHPVKICLVRSLTGSPESGSLDSAHGIQFWYEDDVYIAIAVGDMLRQTFCHEIFHVIETCVLSHSNAYDNWDDLNPEGFAYDYDYIANLNRDGAQYLQAENRAFIDTYSMSYPKEDRARIMEYAVMEGNESYFASKTMQEKLRTLCKGIREAFDLRQYPNELLWEQYLQKPLVP